MSATPRPTDGELDILGVLWRRGPSTVREVHEELVADRGTGYTTTLKLMQVMVGKRLLARDDAQRSHVYRPLLKPEATGRQMMGRLLDRVFAGSTSALVQQALDVGQVDQAELTEIRRLIDAHAARSAKGASGKGRP